MNALKFCFFLMLAVWLLAQPSLSQEPLEWIVQNPKPVPNALWGVWAFSPEGAAAIGEVGTTMMTTDCGSHWATRSLTGHCGRSIHRLGCFTARVPHQDNRRRFDVG